MSIHGVLGESTSYPKTYQPDTLYPIPRAGGRDEIDWQPDALKVGMDWWHAFEVSWLDSQGVSQVAVARFAIPASSPNIIESKSLKLYLNSLNFTEFDSWSTAQQTIAKDLTACAGEKVEVSLFELDAISAGNAENSAFLISHPEGKCIDHALNGCKQKIALVDHPNAELLKADPLSDPAEVNVEKAHKFYSNLLRSNCPVTNQPDWGTLAIEITTSQAIEEAKLLSYILSFRQHNGFHEQCVEQIFADLSQRYAPSKLMVRAWYTRRGGIDINPCRVSDISLLPKPSRLIRQ